MTLLNSSHGVANGVGSINDCCDHPGEEYQEEEKHGGSYDHRAINRMACQIVFGANLHGTSLDPGPVSSLTQLRSKPGTPLFMFPRTSNP